MARVKVCDFCNKILNEHIEQGFRVKILKSGYDYEGWHYKHWEEIDLCTDCMQELYNKCKAKKMIDKK